MKSGIVVLFGLTSFLAAALLFSVQPMIGKMVLPVFGGTPAVWNTCLVFFQGMLLCGYLFSHGVEPQRVDWTASSLGVSTCLVFAALLAIGYLMQPIVLRAGNDRLLSFDRQPGIRPARHFVRLGRCCRW